MDKDLASAIEERWTDYMRLRSEGAIYQAEVRLAEVAHCLQFAHLPPELVSKWNGVLATVSISADAIQSIRNEAEKNIARLNRMLTVGNSLAYEEMLLLVTMRVELEMLFSYLTEQKISDFPDISSLDEALLTALRSPANSIAYFTAQQSAKKNWGLPLRSEWLGTKAVNN